MWTDRIRQVKICLVITAIVIAVTSLVISHILIRDLSNEEKNKMVYPDGLTKEESEYAKKIVSNMKSAQNINYSKWTNANVGTSIKNAIKKTLGISGKPDPVYYRL